MADPGAEAGAGGEEGGGGVRLGVLRSVGASSLAALVLAVLLAGAPSQRCCAPSTGGRVLLTPHPQQRR